MKYFHNFSDHQKICEYNNLEVKNEDTEVVTKFEDLEKVGLDHF